MRVWPIACARHGWLKLCNAFTNTGSRKAISLSGQRTHLGDGLAQEGAAVAVAWAQVEAK